MSKIGRIERRQGAGRAAHTRRAVRYSLVGAMAAVCVGVLAYASSGATSAGTKPFTIGVSNGFTGSPWRTQMLNDMQLVNKAYQAQGLTKPLLIQSATVDVNGQI